MLKKRCQKPKKSLKTKKKNLSRDSIVRFIEYGSIWKW